jgi:hypothetical protein
MKIVRIKSSVTEETRRCASCGYSIQDHNWCLLVTINNDVRLVYKFIHDNGGVCEAKLRAKLKLPLTEMQRFLASRTVTS